MNIFYLDNDPYVAASMQCDKHVVKMILESAQLLSTAHHEIDGESPAYKPTHKNHPSAVWVRQSGDHYAWLYAHMEGLGLEYTKRYGKVHRTILNHADSLLEPPKGIPEVGFTDPPPCMPDEYKCTDIVTSYRNYYRGAKAYMAQWNHSEQPEWF